MLHLMKTPFKKDDIAAVCAKKILQKLTPSALRFHMISKTYMQLYLERCKMMMTRDRLNNANKPEVDMQGKPPLQDQFLP